MTLEPIACNNCGAALEVAADTNFVTCTHCGSRLAVRRTASSRFTELLGKLDAKTDAMAGHLASLAREAEVERIDREWELERDGFGPRHPGRVRTQPRVVPLVAGSIAAGFGLFWLDGAIAIGAPNVFVFFGVLFIAMSIAGGIAGWVHAGRHSGAEQRYHARRAAALRGDRGRAS